MDRSEEYLNEPHLYGGRHLSGVDDVPCHEFSLKTS